MLLLEKRKEWTVDDLFIVCVCVGVHICVCGCMELRVCVCMFSYLWKQPKNKTFINKQSRLVQDTDMAARSHNQNNPHIRKIARTPLSRVSRSLAWYPVLIEKLDRLISCGVFFSRSESCPSRQEHIHSACLCFFETPFSVGSSIDCDFSIYSPFSTLFCLSEIVLLTCIVFGNFSRIIHHTIWARKEEFIQEIADTRSNHRCVLEPPSRSRNTSSISRPFNSLQKPLVSFFFSRRKYSSDVLWFQSERSNRVKHLFSLPMSGSNL